MKAHYPADRDFLATLSAEQTASFGKWIIELQDEMVRRNYPYGPKPVAESTGLECWFSYFEDGLCPADALSEDLTSW